MRGSIELARFPIAYGEEMMISTRAVHVGEGDEESMIERDRWASTNDGSEIIDHHLFQTPLKRSPTQFGWYQNHRTEISCYH